MKTHFKATRGKPKAAATQQPTTVCWLRAEDRPSTQIAKVFCGKAFVSVHLCPVSTPSLRSVGHSPQVHGTQAQYKLATSTYLNVVCNACRKGKKTIKTGRAKAIKTKSKQETPIGAL